MLCLFVCYTYRLLVEQDAVSDSVRQLQDVKRARSEEHEHAKRAFMGEDNEETFERFTASRKSLNEASATLTEEEARLQQVTIITSEWTIRSLLINCLHVSSF